MPPSLMQDSFILLHRQGLTRDEWLNPLRTLAWIDLCCLAAFKDHTDTDGVEIRRGEVIGSYRFFANRWRQPLTSVHRWFAYWVAERALERSMERVVERDAQRFLLVNYAKYQGSKTKAERSTERKTEHRAEQNINNVINNDDKQEIKDSPVDVSAGAPTPKQYARAFFSKDKTAMTAEAQYFIDQGFPVELVRQEFLKFCHYWQAKTPNGKKEIWEKRETFEIRRRLVTWFGNVAEKYQKKGGSLTIPQGL